MNNISIDPNLRIDPALNHEELKIAFKSFAMGTREWCKKEINFMTGCFHACVYCYARNCAHRMGRCKFDEWEHMSNIRWDIVTKKYKKLSSNRIAPWDYMLPTTHDIFPNDLLHLEDPKFQYYTAAKTLLRNLLVPGNTVLITTKPHLDVIQALCDDLEEYQSQIGFRFTIGTTDSQVLKILEPNAPDFEERRSALEYATRHGYATSISAEPLLTSDPALLIDALIPYLPSIVDKYRDIGTIWLGLLKTKYTPKWYLKLFPNAEELMNDIQKHQKISNILPWYLHYLNSDRIHFKESVLRLKVRNNIKVPHDFPPELARASIFKA